MACSKYASTRQTTHAARMSRMLFGPCTDILRDVLRQHIPEASFPTTLQKVTVKGKLLILRNLQTSQKALLYPKKGTFSGSYNDFDISLLYILLRNITDITPHKNGWGIPPDENDRSVSANIDRIRMIRNDIGGHCHRHDLTDDVFFTYSAKIKRSVAEIVKNTGISTNYEKILDDLDFVIMDPEREDYWVECLQRQIKEDQERYEGMEKTMADMQKQIREIKESKPNNQTVSNQTQHFTFQGGQVFNVCSPVSFPAAIENFVQGVKELQNTTDRMKAMSEKQTCIQKKTGYPMRYDGKRIIYIINNDTFEKHENREGSQHDVEALRECFQHLKFEIVSHPNITAEKMKDVMKEASEKDHSNYDCFAVVVMSHGGDGYVIGTDGERVQYEHLYDCIMDCKTLVGKPKIYFIQDNDSKYRYTNCSTIDWMRWSGILDSIMKIPASSLTLNTVENAWSAMKSHLQSQVKPKKS